MIIQFYIGWLVSNWSYVINLLKIQAETFFFPLLKYEAAIYLYYSGALWNSTFTYFYFIFTLITAIYRLTVTK